MTASAAASSEARERRTRSEAQLRAEDVLVNAYFPVIADDAEAE